MIRNAVKRNGIEWINDNHADLVRDTILGVAEKKGKREGRLFEENDARIYDVEILSLEIGDDAIKTMLINNQHSTVKNKLEIAQLHNQRDLALATEETTRETEESRHETALALLDHREGRVTREAEIEEISLKGEEVEVNLEKVISLIKLSVTQDKENQATDTFKQRSEIQVNSIKEALGELSPALVTALEGYSDREVLKTLAEHLPVSDGNLGRMLEVGGMSALINMFKGTRIGNTLESLNLPTTPEDTSESAEA